MAAYSGAYRRTVAPDYSGSHPSRLNWGTGVDPGHAQGEWGSDQGFPALTHPAVPELPPHLDDSYDPETAEPEYSMPFDREPRGHDGYGAPPVNRFDPYAGIAADNARRNANYGATLKNTAPIVGRQHDQRYETPREQSLEVSANNGGSGNQGQALRALRGRNALGENNPGNPEINFSGNYTRRGYEISRLSPRRLARRTLTHTRRDLHLNLAAVAKETKPQTGANYSPYSSAFLGGIGQLRSGIAMPVMRREPRPWDEDVQTDGLGSDDTSEFNSWAL